MALLAPPSMTRRRVPAWVEEPHFERSAIRRAIQDIERGARIRSSGRMDVRSDLAGFRVADARRALDGLPAPGDYRVVVKPLRYRKNPNLSALCEFDERRIILRVPEPFHPFDEIVYHSARRKPVPGWRFMWVGENVRFRTRRDVLRFLYLHEWLHWYMREVLGRRAGAETACDRFALRHFRRREVTVDDAVEALRGCRSQLVPELLLAA
ncbi:MAG: hypothetical protein NVS1B3_15410 [Candidatus Dormibacteraceae bacterium]